MSVLVKEMALVLKCSYTTIFSAMLITDHLAS